MTEPTFTPTDADLSTLDQVIACVTRARRMPVEDAEDFRQFLHLRLIERDYYVFRQFAGRSTLRTYLTVVVSRLLLDWRNQHMGKWRRSMQASRLGAHAETLERLIYRDACTHDEAIETVMRQSSSGPTRQELESLVAQLNGRAPRRFVSDNVLQFMSLPFVDPVVEDEEQREQALRMRALAGALQRLPAEDRRLIKERFHHARTVQALAKQIGADPKALYRRFERILRTLRDALGPHGGSTPMPAPRAS